MSSSESPPAAARGVALSQRDRAIVLLALLGVTAIAWLYLLTIGQGMSGMAMPDMPGMAMPMAVPWIPTAFALTLAMWWGMMLGMMRGGAIG